MPVTEITSSTTTNIKQQNGILQSILVIAPGTTWTLTVKDGPDSAGNLRTVESFTVPAAGVQCVPAPLAFRDGLQIVTSGTAGQVEVSWY